MNGDPGRRPSTALFALVNGFRVSPAIHVAATLGIADLLKDGPRTSDDLAAATGTHAGSLSRLLRALAAVGVFREKTGRRFVLTALGEPLRSDASQPIGPYAIYAGQPYHQQAWNHLLDSVKTGQPGFQHVHGMNVWEYRAQDPAANAIFDAAMTALSRTAADAILEAYDFERFRCVVDVGGRQGALLAAILSKHPSIRGVLFDQPHVVAAAEPVLRASGVADRCQVVGGDIFEAVPSGGDAYILKNVLMDEADDNTIAILRVCRRVIEPNGKLLVIEREIGPPNERAMDKFSDLQMLVMTGGRQRSHEEWAALYAAGGFRLARTISTEVGLSIIEGIAA